MNKAAEPVRMDAECFIVAVLGQSAHFSNVCHLRQPNGLLAFYKEFPLGMLLL
jgi:hypothetical protein